MPLLGTQAAPNLDTDAVSPDRIRRNWQALSKGAVNSVINLFPGGGLTNATSGLGIQLQTASGLSLNSSGLAFEPSVTGGLANTGTGVVINVSTSSTALALNGSNVLAVKVDGTSITFNGTNQLSGLQIDAHGHQIATGGTPTKTAGTGAGSSPTITVTGKDAGGQISVLAGTSPAGGNAKILTVNFATAYASAPNSVVIAEANPTAQAFLLSSGFYVTNITINGFDINTGTLGLTGGSTYILNYMVIG